MVDARYGSVTIVFGNRVDVIVHIDEDRRSSDNGLASSSGPASSSDSTFGNEPIMVSSRTLVAVFFLKPTEGQWRAYIYRREKWCGEQRCW